MFKLESIEHDYIRILKFQSYKQVPSQGSHFSGLSKFHDISRFFGKFPGIFFIIFKVYFPNFLIFKCTNLFQFHLNKDLTF